MQVELGYSQAELTGAFSLAQVVAGVAGIGVGRYLDRHSPRALMTAGSVAMTRQDQIHQTRWTMIEGSRGDNLDVVLEGRAEPVTDSERLQAVAAAFTAEYGTATWHFVVRDGAFSHARAGGRALVFCVRPVRGLGFRKGEHSSQTTWTFPS